MRSSCAISFRAELHRLGPQRARGAPQHPGGHSKAIGHLLAPSPPHLPSGDFLCNEIFPFLKIFTRFYGQVQFSIYICLLYRYLYKLLYSFRRVLKGCYPIPLPEFDKYCFCSKVHRKQHRTNLSSPCWDSRFTPPTFCSTSGDHISDLKPEDNPHLSFALLLPALLLPGAASLLWDSTVPNTS